MFIKRNRSSPHDESGYLHYFCFMLKKIYFGNSPLILSNTETEELKPYLHNSKTSILKTSDKEQLQSLIRAIQHSKIDAGIILNNVSETLEKIKKEFTLILASGGLVYSRDNKILLIYRRGQWDLPKGKLDEGEDLIECALREVKEETGLSQLTYERFICTSYHTYYENNRPILKESHWHLLQGNDQELLIPQTDEDIENCKWVTVEKLAPYLENAPGSIKDVLKTGIDILTKRLNQ